VGSSRARFFLGSSVEEDVGSFVVDYKHYENTSYENDTSYQTLVAQSPDK